jgi:outer membrane cobalamin receptor
MSAASAMQGRRVVTPERTSMVCVRRVLPALTLIVFVSLAAPFVARAATIRGRVVDPDGRPVPGAQVFLRQPISSRPPLVTDSEGAFAAEHLQAGRYDVTVVLPGFQADPISLTVAADDARTVTIGLHVSGVSESIVVSAAQVDVPLSRAADSVTVVDAGRLGSRQVDSVAQALRLVPGLSVASNGGAGSVTSVFPRGGESDYTMVLVDGVPANAFGGGVDLSQLSVAGIDRIEVVRGPQSALFGSDAIGGVIQVITRQGGRPRVAGTIEGGSRGSSRAEVSTSGSHGGWSWGASAERAASRGFTGKAPATGETMSNDDWWSRHVAASGGWHGGHGADVRASVALASTDRGNPGPYGSNPIGAYTAVDRLSRGSVSTRAFDVAAVQPFTIGRVVAREKVVVSRYDLTNDFKSSYGLSQSGTRRLMVREQTDLLVASPLNLSAGVEVKAERATSTFITGEQFEQVPIHRRVIGTFVEARYTAAERLNVTGGVRAEQIRRDTLEADPAAFLPRPTFTPDTVMSVNPKASVSYIVRGGSGSGTAGDGSGLGVTRLRASAGTGIRPPDALEIAFTDNPHLKPERSRSVEGGVEQDFAGGAIVTGATVFSNRYEDLIVAVGPDLRDASIFRTDNISNARSRGVELSTSARTRWGLDVRAGYTYLETALLAVDRGHGQAPAPFVVGQQLLRRPRHQFSADLAIVRSRATAFVQVGARARVLDVEPSYGTYGGLFWNHGYAVVNAGASFRVGRGIEVIGRMANLLDRAYEETLGFPAPGRMITVGVRVAAGR